jgi:hypothetical protein
VPFVFMFKIAFEDILELVSCLIDTECICIRRNNLNLLDYNLVSVSNRNNNQ